MAMREQGRLTECRAAVRADVRRVCAQEQASQRHVARQLELAEATVRRWCGAQSLQRLPGRPRLPLQPERLQELREHIRSVAGRTTVAELKSQFHDIARSVIEAELTALRRDLRIARRNHLAQLTWLRPGSVWATDLTQLGPRPAATVAQSVRDLASDKVLHAGIAPSSKAKPVVQLLEQLFADQGPPLVLKMDNGSCFVAEETKALLENSGVLALYSPPGHPAYNGACEAGIGWLKSTARDVALLNGDLGVLTDDHLERAARVLDARPRTRAANALTADQLWEMREPIPASLRESLRARYAHHEAMRRAALGLAADAILPHAEQASLDRHAIREALSETNLLLIRRR
jgi:transposase InsO family protein